MGNDMGDIIESIGVVFACAKISPGDAARRPPNELVEGGKAAVRSQDADHRQIRVVKTFPKCVHLNKSSTSSSDLVCKYYVQKAIPKCMLAKQSCIGIA